MSKQNCTPRNLIDAFHFLAAYAEKGMDTSNFIEPGPDGLILCIVTEDECRHDSISGKRLAEMGWFIDYETKHWAFSA